MGIKMNHKGIFFFKKLRKGNILPPMTIATDVIKQRIKELGYTHIGVAQRAEISVYTLKKMLSGKYGTPNQYTRKRLARVLEADESVIFLKTDIS